MMDTPATQTPSCSADSSDLLTSTEYIESLRDAREVYLDGERVADVTTHRGFRSSVRSIARLYDTLHDPSQRELLTTIDTYGSRTHRFFAPSQSASELLAARDAVAAWSRLSYGFMGRTPDYKASFMATLGANPGFYAPFDANALSWYRRYASKGLFLNHVLVNPPIDRNKPIQDMRDVFVHVERETDGGIVVSGAKMLATGSALTHATFVAQNSATHIEAGKADDFALVFIAPMGTPGVKLFCRPSYEQAARSPFDNPLSSRFDENDAVMVFDAAVIPWENVLVYRDVERANSFYRASGFFSRYNLHSGTRLGVKLDFMAGLFSKGIAANGTGDFRGVQAALGEILAWRHLIWALTTAMCLDPQPGPGTSVIPKVETAAALRLFATQCWASIRQLFETHLGASPLVVPSSYRDLLNPDERPLIDRFYRGSNGSAEDRIKLFKLIWDAIGSEFGARHALYERNYSGNTEQARLDVLNFARGSKRIDQLEAFAEQCLADYDVRGWTSPTWTFEPDNGSQLSNTAGE